MKTARSGFSFCQFYSCVMATAVAITLLCFMLLMRYGEGDDFAGAGFL